MDQQIKPDARLGRLRGWGLTLQIWLMKTVLAIWALYRFKSTFMNVLFAFLCLGCAFLGVACTHDDDSSTDRSQHRQHQHGSGGYGQGQSGQSDRANSFGSATPIPGL
jgi:hypothetical protein